MTGQKVYYVTGMHCASCEILLEKRILTLAGVTSVDASAGKGEIVIGYEQELPSVEELNKIFNKDSYKFFETKTKEVKKEEVKISNFKSLVIALVIILAFLYLGKSGISSLVNVNSGSSLAALFFFGLLAGLSTCAALVGGVVLSMSKQWSELYSSKTSTSKKLEPHLMFNFGRLISYTLLGAILGAVGGKLEISAGFTSFLVLAVSVLMLVLSLQMLGVKAFQKFQISLPKFITKKVADESRFQGRNMPFVMGALTFFLPCGFTLTAQGLALLSGSALKGALILMFFALGTFLPLLAIGFSSVKFSSRPHWSGNFLKVAGFLVLFFSLYNINAQLNVIGVGNFSDVFSSNKNNDGVVASEDGLPPIVDGKQVVKMQASASGYTPDIIKIRVGVPVRWEITDTGTSGCTSAIISRSLFSGQIQLTPGQVSVKEFTPPSVGRYKFSCWMGMVNGVFDVVGSSTEN